MKRKVLFIFLLLLIIGVSGYLFYNYKKDLDYERFYLSDKYYNKGEFILVSGDELEELENDNYILFTYNNYCSMEIPCEDIFSEFMEKYKIDFLSIPFVSFKETTFYKEVRYAPSVIVVKRGKIVAYLDANLDDDLKRYQDVLEFEKWISNYIYLYIEN